MKHRYTERKFENKFTVADVLSQVEIPENYPSHVHETVQDILNCRTAALGGHIKKCENVECGNVEISYNSCGNRACPTCQWKKQIDWVIKVSENILPVKHSHVVQTIPHEYNIFYLYNKKAFLKILKKCSAQALLELIETKWGVKGGYISVIHTWGSALTIHPHVHMIVPLGGVCVKTGKWKSFKKDFLVSKHALALRFRALFAKRIKKLVRSGKLVTPSHYGYLNNEATLLEFFSKPHSKEWNCFVREPFEDSSKVIRYLGGYTHKIAISNSRIKSIEDGYVTFQYKDYVTRNMDARMTLTCKDFATRFLYHIPEKGFSRIGYGGIYGNAVKGDYVDLAREHVYGETGAPLETLIEVYNLEIQIEKIIEKQNCCKDCNCEMVLLGSVDTGELVFDTG